MIKWPAQIAAILMCFGMVVAHAQSSLSQLQAELVSPWLATVDAESRPRTLRILGIEHSDSGTFVLDAVAFGRRRLLARAPHAGEERVHLAMPHLPAESPLSWSGLLARVCLRAAAMAPMPLPDATADAPTAQPVGAAGTHDADADYSGLRPPRTSMPERSSTSSM